MSTTINRKINHIFILMEKLTKGLELYPQDIQLQQELFGEEDKLLKDSTKANERTLRRYLDEIHKLYSHIIITEKKTKEFLDRKVTVYRVTNKKDVSRVLKFFMEQKNDISWILQMLHEQDPSLIHDLEADMREALEDELKKDEDIFLFNSSPFEIFTSDKHKKFFSVLKQAVKNHEYRDIVYTNYDNSEISYKNLKCLKMIYTQNNWYIGVETEESTFELLRIRFIQEINYSEKIGYQKSVVQKYNDFFNNFENAMSIANSPRKTAILKARPSIAIYFEKDMKKFFKSQEYIRKNDDGSIEFSVKYTQPMEILPFIKHWLPDIKIIEPGELSEAYYSELRKALN